MVSGARRGFSLVELLVALTVFGAGVLGIAAAAMLASGVLRRAAAEQDATRYAALLLDSIATASTIASGMTEAAGLRAVWTADADDTGLLLVEVRVSAPHLGEPVRFAMRAAPPQP